MSDVRNHFATIHPHESISSFVRRAIARCMGTTYAKITQSIGRIVIDFPSRPESTRLDLLLQVLRSQLPGLAFEVTWEGQEDDDNSPHEIANIRQACRAGMNLAGNHSRALELELARVEAESIARADALKLLGEAVNKTRVLRDLGEQRRRADQFQAMGSALADKLGALERKRDEARAEVGRLVLEVAALRRRGRS